MHGCCIYLWALISSTLTSLGPPMVITVCWLGVCEGEEEGEEEEGKEEEEQERYPWPRLTARWFQSSMRRAPTTTTLTDGAWPESDGGRSVGRWRRCSIPSAHKSLPILPRIPPVRARAYWRVGEGQQVLSPCLVG